MQNLELSLLNSIENVLFLDTETSIYNKGHVYDTRNKLVSYALHYRSSTSFAYYSDPGFLDNLRSSLASCSVVCGFNLKFDLSWLHRVGVEIPPNVIVWDLQLAEFIINGQEVPYDSLEAALKRYELPPKKKDLIAEYWDAGISTEDIPVEIVEEYNIADVYPSLPALYQVQMQLTNDKQKKLIILEGEDLKALMAAEYAGIKFDVDEAHRMLSSYQHDIDAIEHSLGSYLPDDIPPDCWNWDSGDCLSALLYGGTLGFKYVQSVSTYKTGAKAGQYRKSWATREVVFPQRFKPIDGTELKKTKEEKDAPTRFYSTDAPTLLQLRAKNKEDKELLNLLRQRNDKIKVVEMISGIMKKMIEKNWQHNYLHGQFNQNVVITGRLSSSQPNLQNQPPEVDKLLVSRYDF